MKVVQEFQEFQSSKSKFNRRKTHRENSKNGKSVLGRERSFCFELDILMLKDVVLQMFNFPHHLSIHEEVLTSH